MPQSEDAARPRLPGWWVPAALVFVLVATLNSGGYRYGVGDQAFYLPAIERHLIPESFPRDRTVIDDQDRLNVFTRVAAAVVTKTAWSLPAFMAGVYLTTLLVLAFGALAFTRTLGLSSAAQVAVLAALTLKHRVGLTGVNTLEGYAHPRMLAFGLGLAAVVLLLRSRPAVAVAMVGLAAVVHPTTALWFVMWIGVALIVTERRARPFLLAAAAVGAAGAAWMILRGPLSAQAVRMDPAWLGVLATKDYLFATDWPGTMWAVAALYVVVVFAIVGFRRAMGLAHTREAALAAGLAALVGVFVVTLPLISQRIAVAVQFQISRVFWMLDLMAVVYAVWALADAGRWRPAPRAAWRGAVVAGLLVCAAVGRGVYVSWVEHPERALVQYDLPKTAWMDVMTWLRQTPVGTHVLADPAHAWREGVSVRVAAGRDVYLEEVKDTAMAMYSRRVAERVAERIGALGDFATLTPASAHALAVRFDLDYLVSTRTLDLPAAHRSGGLTIYRLK